MIPYFSFTSFSLGPLTLHVWGIFLALGFLVGTLAAGWMAKRKGLSSSVICEMAPWFAIAGMIGGRIGHVLFYDPAYFYAHPLEIFAIWQGGLSVYGGILGCILVFFIFGAGLKPARTNASIDMHAHRFAYADALIFGLPFGKIFGRIGCFLIHDHPGTLTHFILGVKYPDGEVRHDLGLYLAINAFFLSLLFLLLARKNRPTGTYIVVFSLWYGTTRFFLDFLRVVDVRYMGFTPGQYLSLLLIIFGIGMALWITRKAKRGESS